MIPALNIWNSAQHVLSDEDGSRYTLARFCDALNEAQADFTNNVDYTIERRFMSIPPNYNSVSLANMANKIVRVEYVDPSNNEQFELEKTGIERLDYECREWRSDNYASRPRYYVVNKQNDCEFFIYPLARMVEGTLSRFGILESTSSELNLTSDFGVIENLAAPYLQVFYSARPQEVEPNADNTDIVFVGTTERAILPIQIDVMHCLKNYCIATMFVDDNEQLQQQIAAQRLALYNRGLKQIRAKKASNYSDSIERGFYNTGFMGSNRRRRYF